MLPPLSSLLFDNKSKNTNDNNQHYQPPLQLPCTNSTLRNSPTNIIQQHASPPSSILNHNNIHSFSNNANSHGMFNHASPSTTMSSNKGNMYHHNIHEHQQDSTRRGMIHVSTQLRNNRREDLASMQNHPEHTLGNRSTVNKSRYMLFPHPSMGNNISQACNDVHHYHTTQPNIPSTRLKSPKSCTDRATEDKSKIIDGIRKALNPFSSSFGEYSKPYLTDAYSESTGIHPTCVGRLENVPPKTSQVDSRFSSLNSMHHAKTFTKYNSIDSTLFELDPHNYSSSSSQQHKEGNITTDRSNEFGHKETHPNNYTQSFGFNTISSSSHQLMHSQNQHQMHEVFPLIKKPMNASLSTIPHQQFSSNQSSSTKRKYEEIAPTNSNYYYGSKEESYWDSLPNNIEFPETAFSKSKQCKYSSSSENNSRYSSNNSENSTTKSIPPVDTSASNAPQSKMPSTNLSPLDTKPIQKNTKTIISSKSEEQLCSISSITTNPQTSIQFMNFSISDKSKIKFVNARHQQIGINDGAWTDKEHDDFMRGLNECGKGRWREIAENYVKTRTRTQVASHARKYLDTEPLNKK